MEKDMHEDILKKCFDELKDFDEIKKAKEKGILLPLKSFLYDDLIDQLYKKVKNLIKGGELDSLSLTKNTNLMEITSVENDIEEIVFNKVFDNLKIMNKNHHEESIIDDDIFLEALFVIRDEGILSLTLDDLDLKKELDKRENLHM